jgi:hypothetical protein
MANKYEQKLHELILSGQWQPGDPVPVELIDASNDVGVGPVDIGELPTMTIQGTAPSTAPSEQPGFKSIYDELSDEDLKKFGAMGDLERQLAQAEAMRTTDPLKGRYVNQGRTYVADSPLAHIVRGAQIYKGTKDVGRIGGEQTAGRQTIIDLLRNRNRDRADIDLDDITDNLPAYGTRMA